MNKDFTQLTYLSFDTETTGTIHGVDRIVQIGFSIYKHGELEKRYNWDINPEIKVPQAATEVHGLTDSYLKTQKTLKEVYYEVLDALIEHDDVYEYLAYNSDFDTQMLSNEFERIARENKGIKSMHDYIVSKKPDYIPHKYRTYYYDKENNTYCYTGKKISELTKKERITSFIDMFKTADLMPALVQASRDKEKGRESLDAVATKLGVDLSKRAERHDATVDAEIAMECYFVALKAGLLDKPITDLEMRFTGMEEELVQLTPELRIEPEVAQQAVSFKDRKRKAEVLDTQINLNNEVKRSMKIN